MACFHINNSTNVGHGDLFFHETPYWRGPHGIPMKYDDLCLGNSQKPVYYCASNQIVIVGHSDLLMTGCKLTFQKNLSIKYEPCLTLGLVENDVRKCVKHHMKLGHSDLIYTDELHTN